MKPMNRSLIFLFVLLSTLVGIARAEDAKPLIAVTPQYDAKNNRIFISLNYLEAVEKSGGVPVLLHLTDEERHIDEMAKRFDGFLFTGGPDVAPTFYGQETEPFCETICDRRDSLEIKLMQKALALDKPVFGICRGCQLLNVVLGGTLYQDIPTQLAPETKTTHRAVPPGMSTHAVTITEDTILYELFGKKEATVNSYHHQGIRNLASSLKPLARSPDGLIEAVHQPEKRFVLGVQWHPDSLWRTDPDSLKLFKTFVERCRRRQTARP